MNCLVRTATGQILLENLSVRATFRGRLKGMLFRCEQETGAAMLLVNTKRVHTHGMFFPLDLYFFDHSMRLIGSRRRIMPWKGPPSPAGTRHILEIQSAAAAPSLDLAVGEQVSILWRLKP